MKNFVIALVAMCFASTAFGGTFEITEETAGHVDVHYTGMVTFDDVAKWRAIVEIADGKIIYLTIDSGGGYAFAGVDLYWELEAYPYLVTIAGNDFGAWSAAAIMWTAGDYRQVAKGGGVWFHAAYCTWDSDPFPSIGCNTLTFQEELVKIFDDAGYNGRLFNQWLNVIQYQLGTDGWIGLTNSGWWLLDSTSGWQISYDPSEIKK